MTLANYVSDRNCQQLRKTIAVNVYFYQSVFLFKHATYKKRRRWKTLFEVVDLIAESQNHLCTGDLNYYRKVREKVLLVTGL